MKLVFCIFSLSLTAQFQWLHSASPQKIPIKTLVGNVKRTLPKIAPDSSKLAFLAQSDSTIELWYRDLQKKTQTKLTQSDRDIQDYWWQPDSRYLIYLGKEPTRQNTHLYQVDSQTGNIRDLTPFQGVQARMIALNPLFPDKMLVGLNLRQRMVHEVYRLNLMNGSITLEESNPGNVIDWCADGNLQVGAKLSIMQDGNIEFSLREDLDSPWQAYKTYSPEEGIISFVGYSPDRTKLWYLGNSTSNYTSLWELDLISLKSNELIASDDADITELLLHPVLQHPEGVKWGGHKKEWGMIQTGYQDIIDFLKYDKGDLSFVNRNHKTSQWVVSYSQDTKNRFFYIYTSGTRHRTQLLFQEQEELNQYKLVPTEPITFKALDGRKINGWLTMPDESISQIEKPPLVIKISEKSSIQKDWGVHREAQWLANRGYACLEIIPRGLLGDNARLSSLSQGYWFETWISDLEQARKWVVETSEIDAKRVGLMGSGLGGYAIMKLLSKNPENYACGISLNGISHIPGFLKRLPVFYQPLVPTISARYGNVGDNGIKINMDSPFNNAGKINKPLLLVHGGKNTWIRVNQSQRMFDKMKANSQDVQIHVFPEEGESSMSESNRIIYYEKSEDFLNQYIGKAKNTQTGNTICQ
jgi:dipeptidyl aminopeptidase/acylaminoacyl peptidase